MRYEVFTLGKHFLQVHTSKGFTLFANAKLNPNGEVVSYTDKLVRRGGSWVIDTWKFLTVKAFPQNPIYCAVFGFDDNDMEVKVNATDIDVDSISGVNGQLVDVGNISIPEGSALPVTSNGLVFSGFKTIDFDFTGWTFLKGVGQLKVNNPQVLIGKACSLLDFDRGEVLVNFATTSVSGEYAFRFDGKPDFTFNAEAGKCTCIFRALYVKNEISSVNVPNPVCVNSFDFFVGVLGAFHACILYFYKNHEIIGIEI